MIIERMAAELGLPLTFIQNLARGASHEYKEYEIAKRSGGFRTIHHPSRRLKAPQRWLLVNVIEPLPVHPAAAAYRRRKSIFDNAAIHVRSRYLLRMDLENFFPSITENDIQAYVAGRATFFADWTAADIDIFCKFVCRHSVLTIGAPTSPALSNVLCYDMDVQIHELSARSGVNYSRYADDLFFSTEKPNVLRQLEKDIQGVFSDLKLPARLKVNPAKTRHSSKRGARRVTGIVLGSDGRPYVGRQLKRKIRALIHQLDSLDPDTRLSLAGLIIYVRGFDPQFINSLIAKYDLEKVRNAMNPRPPA